MYKPGVWKAVCDVCGFEYKSHELRKRWDGLMVCSEDYETRHPQDFIRVKAETIVPPWTRPEPPDDFVFMCYIWGLSAYADLAEADCARADYALLPYNLLVLMKAGMQ